MMLSLINLRVNHDPFTWGCGNLGFPNNAQLEIHSGKLQAMQTNVLKIALQKTYSFSLRGSSACSTISFGS